MKCYSNCISSHQDWRDFTILDFCRVLGIPLEQDDYEILLGYINKINRYLKHMNCRSCNHILRPVSRSGGAENGNYGFYRVSNFACLNSQCKEHMQIIYLTHCTNGYCGGIIDQRDSVKCIPKDAPHANCGWYICIDCLACCNTHNINNRKYTLNITGQGYHGHNIGHLDLGKICCPKCGYELQRNGENAEKFKEVLTWLIDNRDSSPTIIKYGQRKTDGKYWFLLTRDSQENIIEFRAKLIRLVSYGFNIPDISQAKASYMVSEPFMGNKNSLLFNCTKCDYSLDLANNGAMHAAMRNYHKKLNITRQYV